MASLHERIICLKAQYVGQEVLALVANPNFVGTVHSVFRNAVNILPKKSLLITVLSTPEKAEWALNVKGEIEFTQFRIAPGACVIAHDNELLVGSKILVDFQGADVWRMPNVVFRSAATREEICQRIRLVATVVGIMGTRGGFGELLFEMVGDDAPSSNKFTRRAKPRIMNLLRAIWEGREDLIQESSAALAGLGVGATPSGDDYLVGLMLGFRYREKQMHLDTSYTNVVCQTIAGAIEGKTSPLSESYIKYASRGVGSESVLSFMTSLLSDGTDLIGRAIALLQIGATSGEDIIVGITSGIILALSMACLKGSPLRASENSLM